MAAEALTCPMCSFSVSQCDSYFLALHFEQEHTEDSGFKVTEGLAATSSSNPRPPDHAPPSPSSGLDEEYALCPEAECGEMVFLNDFNDHLDLHDLEKLTLDDTAQKRANMQSLSRYSSSSPSFVDQSFSSQSPDALPSAKRRRGSSSEKSVLHRKAFAKRGADSRKLRKAEREGLRLGRRELGPYAWEDKMPGWLHKQLIDGPRVSVVNRIGRDGQLILQETVENETPGVIPILSQLSALDKGIEKAYYCHPSTVHIFKTPKEGGFCGYRNIQMLLSYITGAKARGHEQFQGRTPSILKLQDWIEDAWDQGINEIGRAQTGGIKGSRKYIGTPEAQAMFLRCRLDCSVQVFSDGPNGIQAHDKLLDAIQRYFESADTFEKSGPSGNVIGTYLPPIYLQQPGHSITIVGFERRKDRSGNLVVFDPIYRTSPAMHRLLGRRDLATSRPEVMQSYRKGERQLKKHRDFEMLMLTAIPPRFPSWAVTFRFPDCRYVYVFFRSLTLGYDVYPIDHFLHTFPWHAYGGLFIVEDARFARSDISLQQKLAGVLGDGSDGMDISAEVLCLLGVPALGEKDIVALQFWRACGNSICAFGCGKGDRQGELEAEKRLFI